MNFAILFRFSPWFQRGYQKFNPTLFHWAKAFFHKRFGGFVENISPDFEGSLFYIVKHIRLNIEPAFCQSVSPSVRQSISPSVRQSVSLSVRQSGGPSVRQSASSSVRPLELAIIFSTVPGFRACYFNPGKVEKWNKKLQLFILGILTFMTF